jgi:hypothetical protein
VAVVEFRNAGAGPARVSGFGTARPAPDGAGRGLTDFPGLSLRSDRGAAHPPAVRAVIDPDIGEEAPHAVIPPGGTAVVSFSFEPPPKDAKELYLELPAADFGQPAAAVRFRIPAAMVKPAGR